MRSLWLMLLSAGWLFASPVWVDKNTGLMWQDEPYTQAEQNALFTRTYGKVQNWQGAKNYCQKLNYAGYSDWYLPNIDELKNLYTKKYKLKNMISRSYWSSSASVSNAEYAWGIFFDGGDSNSYRKADKFYVRCTRPGQ